MKRIMSETARGRSISSILIFLCVVAGASCLMMKEPAAGQESDMPRVVRIGGIERLCNYPPLWCATARASRPAAILARDGDLFLVGKDHLFLYRETDGESLLLKEQGGVLLLNGKAVSVGLSGKGRGWEWLRKASTEELSGLRFLRIGPQANALDFPLLQKIAWVRPDIGLFLDIKQPDVAARLVSLFEPGFLSIDLKVLSEQFDALEPRLGNLKVLLTGGEGPLDFLPRLPRLHTLRLSGGEPTVSGGIPGNRNLRSVTIMGEKGAVDLSFLRNLTGLQELILWGVDVKDITALASFPDLKKLVLFFDKSNNPVDISVLDRLPKLTWLGFPGNTTQEAFANVIASHPDLEVVELPGSDNIRDLSPLLTLRHLRAAIASLKNADVGTLQELKSLRYLALVHKDTLEGAAAEKMAALEKALPETFVAQAEPFCLGSGWILLLVPAIVLLRSLWSRGRGPRCEAHA